MRLLALLLVTAIAACAGPAQIPADKAPIHHEDKDATADAHATNIGVQSSWYDAANAPDAPSEVTVPHSRKLGSNLERWSYLAGSSTGTVTVAAGQAVTSVMVTAGAASSATLTICPQGPSTVVCVTGPTITVPTSQSLFIPPTALPNPASGQLADGSVLVFGGGLSAYVVTLQQVSP